MTARVLHVIETLDMGGAENVVANIVNNVSESFSSTICCVKRSGAVAKAIRRPGVDIVELGKGEGNSFFVPFQIASLLKKRKIDVLQVHNWGAYCEAVAGAMIAGTPRVFVMSHGGFHNYAPGSTVASLKKALRRRLERFLAGWVDRFIAVSEKVQGEIISEIGIAPEKIRVIRNGVDVSVAMPNLAAKRAELGLRETDKVIGSVGRLVPGKNYPYLIERFPEIAEQTRGELKLVLIGEGPERKNIEAAVGRLGLNGRVFVLGERGDAREWLPLFDAFVLPSLYEGVSIALLEAMAAARPIVALRVGGNPEIVTTGENGYLVNKDDAAGFVKNISSLMNDGALASRMGSKGREWVRERYGMDRVVKRYEALYRGEKI